MIIDINEWAANRNTDITVAKCIAKMSNGDADEAERIWAEPWGYELWEIFVGVAVGKGIDEYDVVWGDTTLGDLLDNIAA